MSAKENDNYISSLLDPWLMLSHFYSISLVNWLVFKSTALYGSAQLLTITVYKALWRSNIQTMNIAILAKMYKMTWKQTCGWFVLATMISCSAAVSLRETFTVTIGDSENWL